MAGYWRWAGDGLAGCKSSSAWRQEAGSGPSTDWALPTGRPADRPTGNLDGLTRQNVRQLLRGLCAQEGSTVLTVTHDAGLAAGAGCVIALVDERVQESTPKA